MSSSKKFTCKRTLRQVFIKAYRLQIQSVMLVFGSPHPPFPPSLRQRTVWVAVWSGGGGGYCRIGTIYCRSLTLCNLTRFRTYNIARPPPQKKNQEGRGPQTCKHLQQSTFTGKIYLDDDILHTAVVFRTLNRLGDSSVPFPNSPSTPDCIPAFYSFIQGASPTGTVLQKFHYVRVHCNEKTIYVFPEKELRVLSPNFHIHSFMCL
jgi:hypothetical protein